MQRAASCGPCIAATSSRCLCHAFAASVSLPAPALTQQQHAVRPAFQHSFQLLKETQPRCACCAGPGGGRLRGAGGARAPAVAPPAGGAPGRRRRHAGRVRGVGARPPGCAPACLPLLVKGWALLLDEEMRQPARRAPHPRARLLHPAGAPADWQPPAALRASHAKAQAAAELRQPYESSVAAGKPADQDLLAAYMAYVKVEEKQGDPARVQVCAVLAEGVQGWREAWVQHCSARLWAALPLCPPQCHTPPLTPCPSPASPSQVAYERAVAAFPVTHFLWLQYGRYLETSLKIGSGGWPATARAQAWAPGRGLGGRVRRSAQAEDAPASCRREGARPASGPAPDSH